MFYTAAWCLTNESDFKKSVPFELLGESIKRYNSITPFNIVILEGINLLSTSYLILLKTYGFIIIDYCENFKKIIKRFESIDKFHSKYERNCFLRWVAFNEIRKTNNDNSQFWHLDSDVILHTSLDSLVEDTLGKTFMLQGCPVFVSVASNVWFECYERELINLNSDIIGYSQNAQKEKSNCIANDMVLANESVYRYPMGHDQDLLEYLISSKKIIQEEAVTIYNSKYYYIQNPLSLKKWHYCQTELQSIFTYEANFTIRIANKSVPFIHYQNTFAAYAALYCFQKQMMIPNLLVNKILKFKIDEGGFKVGLHYKILMKIKNWLEGMNREETIKMLMEEKSSQNPLLIDLLNLLLAQ